jgi:Insertion element 4 transposase N-terminal/Transposase DDE domain
LSQFVMPAGSSQCSSGSLRGVVLAGPGSPVALDGQDVGGVLEILANPGRVAVALDQAGHVDVRRRVLTAPVTTALVLGLCLFTGQCYSGVLARLWPLLGAFNPGIWMWATVSASALSQARARLPVAVMRALFEGLAGAVQVEVAGLRVFGLVVTAVDGTVVDLADTAQNRERFATPAAGRFPQARLITLVVCGTRRVLAAVLDSCALSEQALWDRMVGQLRPGTLNLSDRNFFSMHRWRTAAGTGAHLIWRVKNGAKSLPAKVITTLPDGSHLVRLRESDGMLSARRKANQDKTIPRLDDITARLVEFTITLTDDAGLSRTSQFRVLTTLLDPDAYPADQVAACYAERWQVELVYKRIKSTLRGSGRRLRGQVPDLAEQEIWGLLAVYNTLVDQAITAAVDLGVDPDEISFSVVLHAARDHIHRPCQACGHHPTPQDLTAAIITGPRNRTGRHRTSPRTSQDRQIQHTRNVAYTITITQTNLFKTDKTP